MFQRDFEGGKYTVAHDNGVGLRALRHGDPWRELNGDGLVLAMAQEVEGLDAEVRALKAQLAEAQSALAREEARANGLAEALAASNGALSDVLGAKP